MTVIEKTRPREKERTIKPSAAVKYKNEPDKWTMPLMITDRCTKKPVAHIWNFIFLYAYAPFLCFFFCVSRFIHHTNPSNRYTHFNTLCVWVLFIFSAQKSSQYHRFYLYLWHRRWRRRRWWRFSQCIRSRSFNQMHNNNNKINGPNKRSTKKNERENWIRKSTLAIAKFYFFYMWFLYTFFSF